MSNWCVSNSGRARPTPSLADVEKPYPGGLISRVPNLPEMMKDGMASDRAIQEFMNNPAMKEMLPEVSEQKLMELSQSTPFTAPGAADPLARYVEKENAFADVLSKEYCWYEAAYFVSLDDLLNTISRISAQGGPADAVQPKLDRTRRLNQILTFLTQLANAVAKNRYQQAQNQNSQIDSINGSLQGRKMALQKQNEILRRESAAADLHKQMMEYTAEKNRANLNLLSLYGVLNIVAMAMIVYIARS
jgi:hypothetical protein